MGPQNIRNHYFKKVKAKVSGDNHHDLELSQDELMSIDFKLSHDSYYDLYLASDEEDYNKQVVYSTSIIDSSDGNNLPVWVDLNSSLSRDTTRNTMCADQIILSSTPLTILSKNIWGGARSTCSTASTTFTICDIMWTGMDNGLWDGRALGVPNCLTLKNNTNASSFDRFQYDKRFKLNQVKDLSINSSFVTTDMSITLNADSSGYYYDLKGGFFQGFYKLYGYPYEVLPNRPNKGWTFETYLKIHAPSIYESHISCYTVANNEATQYCSNGGSATTLNYNNGGSYPPDNGGFFFYKGIRAEDKWGFSGSTNMNQTILSACTTITGLTDCCGFEDGEVLLLGQSMSQSHTPKHDTFSNAIGFRLTEDMRIGYRTIRYDKYCVDTGEILTGGGCATGTTNQQASICDYTIEESYSDPICPYITLSGTCADIWLQVDVVFERDLYIDECDLYNDGGVNDLIKVRSDKFYRHGHHFEEGDGSGDCGEIISTKCGQQYPEFISEAYFNYECKEPQVQKWFSERDFRMGTLKFYVNGRIVHTVNDYEEIIPRQLNTNKETQVGVAYNMSWGGGSQGLRNMVVPSVTACSETYDTWIPNQMSPNEKLISDNFGGSFVGGISQMMYYVKPLQADEIYHNFKINKDRYSLIDCEECENCPAGCIDCELPSGTTGTTIVYTTYIPDVAFRAALTALGIAFDQSYRTETSNISSLTSLDVNDKGIIDMTGIEDFIALTVLYCYNNQLTSLDLTNLTALTYLRCSVNQLTSLDVSNNTALGGLYCDNNQLTNLDVSTNTVLTNLSCYANQLTTLNVNNNTALTYLGCHNNQLTTLNVSTNIALTHLYCYANQLITLNVSGAIALTSLYCYNNQLTSLDVSLNVNLWRLHCYANQLPSLNLNQNVNLKTLRAWTNSFTSLDFTYNPNITLILCGDNNITNLDVSGATALTLLNCGGNQLISLDVSNNTALERLYCYKNQLTSLDVRNNTALTELNCYDNNLTSLDVRNGNNTIMLVFKTIGNNNLFTINVDVVLYSSTNWTNIDAWTYFID